MLIKNYTMNIKLFGGFRTWSTIAKNHHLQIKILFHSVCTLLSTPELMYQHLYAQIHHKKPLLTSQENLGEKYRSDRKNLDDIHL